MLTFLNFSEDNLVVYFKLNIKILNKLIFQFSKLTIENV